MGGPATKVAEGAQARQDAQKGHVGGQHDSAIYGTEQTFPSEEGELEEKTAEDKFSGAARQCWAIVHGAVVSSAAYGAMLLTTGGDAQTTEDIVDLAHSAYTSSVAMSGLAHLEPHAEHLVALPAGMAASGGRVVKMFCHSIGYFFADVALIFTELGLFGRKPNLWQGRLAHHLIQAFAVLPCIFRTESWKQVLALRSVLCIAYFAEFSNIFLRLSNILRRRKHSVQRMQSAVNLALMLSFAASRVVNFPFAIYVFARARQNISPGLFRMIGAIQASGYLLNIVWFAKIVNILMKPSSLPSIEC